MALECTNETQTYAYTTRAYGVLRAYRDQQVTQALKSIRFYLINVGVA